MAKPPNAMQAALDRAAKAAVIEREVAEPGSPAAPTPKRVRRERGKVAALATDARPSRKNTRLIGGHFSPEVARQLRILAAEEDTTIQALLEEAINLLLAKKAKSRLADNRR